MSFGDSTTIRKLDVVGDIPSIVPYLLPCEQELIKLVTVFSDHDVYTGKDIRLAKVGISSTNLRRC